MISGARTSTLVYQLTQVVYLKYILLDSFIRQPTTSGGNPPSRRALSLGKKLQHCPKFHAYRDTALMAMISRGLVRPVLGRGAARHPVALEQEVRIKTQYKQGFIHGW